MPALEHLRRKGWRQTVVSNHVPEFDGIVDTLGISGFFGAVVSSGINAD